VRLLGIDVGEARTGVAVSDRHAITCSPLPVIVERNRDEVLLRIVALAEEHGVGQIVVGLPRPLKGGTNRQMEETLEFMSRLEKLIAVPVLAWDERYTSKLAGRPGARGAGQDSVAACYLLQSYLDSQAGHDLTAEDT
jgi:putative holliday junction resolvase